MPVTRENVDEVFSYHAPDDEQKIAFMHIRTAAQQLAKVILEVAPQCADQQAALRQLRECVMTANAAVALKGAI